MDTAGFVDKCPPSIGDARVDPRVRPQVGPDLNDMCAQVVGRGCGRRRRGFGAGRGLLCSQQARRVGVVDVFLSGQGFRGTRALGLRGSARFRGVLACQWPDCRPPLHLPRARPFPAATSRVVRGSSDLSPGPGLGTYRPSTGLRALREQSLTSPSTSGLHHVRSRLSGPRAHTTPPSRHRSSPFTACSVWGSRVGCVGLGGGVLWPLHSEAAYWAWGVCAVSAGRMQRERSEQPPSGKIRSRTTSLWCVFVCDLQSADVIHLLPTVFARLGSVSLHVDLDSTRPFSSRAACCPIRSTVQRH